MKWVGLFSAAAATLLGSATPPPAAEASPIRNLRLAYTADLATLGEADVVMVTDPPAPAERVQWGQLGEVGGASPAEDAARASRPWATDSALDGPIRVVVSLPQQKAFVFSGDSLVATSRVSTGKRGHATPVGTFRIMQKKVTHYSNLYDNAPMPYMQRLTSGGVALHAGHVPGYRASHGCIRLPRSFAKKLYGMTSMGTPVVVTNQHVPTT